MNRPLPRVMSLALLALSTTLVVAQPKPTTGTAVPTHPYVGMWVTADGYIRHELLPNNRYDEARGNQQSAYQGRYTVKGNRIDHAGYALNIGVSEAELKEIIYLVTVPAGFPKAIRASQVLSELFAERRAASGNAPPGTTR